MRTERHAKNKFKNKTVYSKLAVEGINTKSLVALYKEPDKKN